MRRIVSSLLGYLLTEYLRSHVEPGLVLKFVLLAGLVVAGVGLSTHLLHQFRRRTLR